MNVAEYSQSLADAASEAEQWVKKNGELVRNEQEGLLKDLRKARRNFIACKKAAQRKMCAGVFGPSQAGKSYLISALARGKNNELNAKFGAKTYDFLKDINPEGGKESTGLVTRFTLSEKNNIPAEYPVQLRLLSETDLVKIIANTYFADCEHMEDAQSNIESTLEKLRSRTSEEGKGLDLDSLEEIREYLNKDFRGKARVQELEKVFWDEALKLGQKLDLEGRIQLYALIWDEVEELTELLRLLLQVLEKLKYPEELFCTLDALIPRDKSIIDVSTLKKLGNKDEERVKAITREGLKAEIPRSILAALTAELTIIMQDKPADYFEHTDLLDFPGYRSRYQLEDIGSELKKQPGMLQELFLRGKVAYLFQRYCSERELNNMLLCIGPGNQEVQDLPGVISDWVNTTHGVTPEERKGKPVSLFFVLTKFDMEFEDKKGAPSLQLRWDNRLKASMLDFFGKQRDWPTHWTPEQGFNNIFLLRNPNFKFDAILSFNNDEETGIRPERTQFVEDLRNAFLNSELVNAHFANPALAWNEAMRLNDGGISLIRKSLSPMCDPKIKERQLLDSINSWRNSLLRRLRPFYQSDDREELRKQKGMMAYSLLSRYKSSELFRKRLGILLHDLTINTAEIYDLYPEAARRFREGNHADMAEVKTVPEVNPNDFSLDALKQLMNEVKTVSTNTDKTDLPKNDEASFYASYIENKWVEHLHQLADDPELQQYYLLNPQEFSFIASELAVGAARLGFKEKLSESLRKAAAYANTRKELIAKKQSAIAAMELNAYINKLDSTKDNNSPTPEVKSRIKNIPELSDSPHDFTALRLGEWLNSLATLIMKNVDFDGEKSINQEENSTLGAIIKQLDLQVSA